MNTILALDLGKFKSVACIYATAEATHAFRTVPTTPQALHDLIVEVGPPPEALVIEVGPAAGWVKDLSEALKIPIQVANPNHEAWRGKNLKRKTDKDDALKLAQLSALGQLPMVTLPGTKVRQGRSLIAYRHSLVPPEAADGDQELLRSLLVEVSWLMRRYHPRLQETFDRVCRGSKTRRKIAVVATARKLLVICWAMLRDGTPWREPKLPTPPVTAGAASPALMG